MATTTTTNVRTAIVDAFPAVAAAKAAQTSYAFTRRGLLRQMLADADCWIPSTITTDGSWAPIPNALMVALNGSDMMLSCYGHLATDLLQAAIDAVDPLNEVIRVAVWEKVCDGTYIVRWTTK